MAGCLEHSAAGETTTALAALTLAAFTFAALTLGRGRSDAALVNRRTQICSGCRTEHHPAAGLKNTKWVIWTVISLGALPECIVLVDIWCSASVEPRPLIIATNVSVVYQANIRIGGLTSRVGGRNESKLGCIRSCCKETAFFLLGGSQLVQTKCLQSGDKTVLLFACANIDCRSRGLTLTHHSENSVGVDFDGMDSSTAKEACKQNGDNVLGQRRHDEYCFQ